MGRPTASARLDEHTRSQARDAARRGARLHRRIRDAERRHADRVAALAAERDAAWREATRLGMSRSETARAAGLHHSAVDRAIA